MQMPDGTPQVEAPPARDRITELFTYHAPTEEDKAKYKNIRNAAMYFARVVEQECPSCPDRTMAIRKIREAVMTANASIALRGIS